MAINATFAFTNTSIRDQKMDTVDVDAHTNYSKESNLSKGGKTVYSNNTAPTDQPELITVQARDIKQVDTQLKVYYPAPVKNGVAYSLKLENLLKITSTDDLSFRRDLPIVLDLGVRHPVSEYITKDVILELLERMMGILQGSGDDWLTIVDLQRKSTDLRD